MKRSLISLFTFLCIGLLSCNGNNTTPISSFAFKEAPHKLNIDDNGVKTYAYIGDQLSLDGLKIELEVY